jgi:hypothetical protein
MAEPMFYNRQLCGCPSLMCLWCFFILVSILRPVCPMHSWPHSHGTVKSRSLLSSFVHHRTKETGDPPKQKSNKFHVFGQHSAKSTIRRLDIWKQNDWSVLQPYWMAPRYWELTQLIQSSVCKLLIGTAGFLLGFLTLNMEPIGCPETSVRNYQYSQRNNTEGRVSHLA